jgi:protocatechuate 3,4-dioxygenase beta subunit
MKKIVIGLMTMMLLIVISLIYTTTTTTTFAQSSQISTLPLQQQQQQDSFCKLTKSDMLGPFYKENAPFKQRLGEGIEGERLIITGKVMNMRCQPLKDAILDVWQANSTGEYDNKGFTLRGKVKTNNDGIYLIDTIIPKEYSTGDITRPGHIHLKVGVPNQPTLTTQLYFEGDPYLTELEDKSLVMKTTEANGTKKAKFDFVIENYKEYNK